MFWVSFTWFDWLHVGLLVAPIITFTIMCIMFVCKVKPEPTDTVCDRRWE